MVTSVNSGNNNSQALQRPNQPEQQPNHAELTRQREAADAKRRQAEQAQNNQAQNNQLKPPPTVNAQGQTTGSIINTTA